MSLASMLIHTMDVLETATGQSNRTGAPQDGATTVKYADVPCHVQPVRAQKKVMFEQQNIRATHTIYFERDMAVIVDGDTVRWNGLTFHVLSVSHSHQDQWPSELSVEEVK